MHQKRHPDNDKLRLYVDPIYQGFDVMQHEKGPLIENYLESSLRILHHCVQQQHLTFAIRIDLRFPADMPYCHLHTDNRVLTRFFRHLRYELQRDRLKYPVNLRYIWAREQAESDKPHYHLMLLLNKNAIHTLGTKAPDDKREYSRSNLYHRLSRAWLKAMGFAGDDPRFGQLVNVSRDQTRRRYWSIILHRDDQMAMSEAVYMASYLCKAYSKHFAQGVRVFDTSHIWREKGVDLAAS